MALGTLSKQISREVLGVMNDPSAISAFLRHALGERLVNPKIIDDLSTDILKVIDDGNIDEWIARTRKSASDEVREVLDNPNFRQSLKTAKEYDDFSVEFGELYIKGDDIDLDAIYTKHGIENDELREAARGAIEYRQNFINEKAKELAGENGNPAEHMAQAKDAWNDEYSKFIDEERLAAKAAENAGAKTAKNTSSGRFDPFPEFSPSRTSFVKNLRQLSFSDNIPMFKVNIYRVANQKADAREILDPLIEYYSKQMNKVDANGFSMTYGIKQLNDEVLEAVEKGKSAEHIQDMIDKFGKDNEASLKEFSENMKALRNHVEKTYKTNKELTTKTDSNGVVITAGTDETRRSTDFITRQKDATIKWLDHMTDVPLDLIKGADGDLGKEMLHNAERARGDRTLLNKFKGSVTGLSSAVEIAIREVVRETKKLPDGSDAVKDYVHQIRSSLNAGFYLRESRGLNAEPVMKSSANKDEKGNLAFTAFGDIMDDFTAVKEDGSPAHPISNSPEHFPNFIAAVDTLAGELDYAEAIDAIDFVSHILYSEVHKKYVRNMLDDANWKIQMDRAGKYDNKAKEYTGDDPRQKEFYEYIQENLRRDQATITAGNPDGVFDKLVADEYLKKGSRTATTKAYRGSAWAMKQDRFGMIDEPIAFEGRQIINARRSHIVFDTAGFLLGAEARSVPVNYQYGAHQKDFAAGKVIWKGDHLPAKVWNASKNILSRSVSGLTVERAASDPALKHGLNWSLQTKKQKEAGTGYQTTALGSVALASGGAYAAGRGVEWISNENDWETTGDIAHSINNISGNVFDAATIPFTLMIKDPALGLWDKAWGNGLGDDITDGIMSVTKLDNKRLDTEEIDEALAEIESTYSDAADTAKEEYDTAKEQLAIVKEELRQAKRLKNSPDEINRLTARKDTIENRLEGISLLQVEMEKRHKIIQASIDKVDSNSALGLGIWHKDEKKNLPFAKDAYKKAYDALVDTGAILTLIGNENLTMAQVNTVVTKPTSAVTADNNAPDQKEETVESATTQEQDRQKSADKDAAKIQVAAEKQAQAEALAKAKLELEKIKDTPLGKAKIAALAAMAAVNGNVATAESNVTKAEDLLKRIDAQAKTVEDLKKEIIAGANSADKQVRINNLDKLLNDIGERRQDAVDKVTSLKSAAASAKEIELSAVVLSEEIANIPNTNNQANTDQAVERLADLQMQSDISKAISNDSASLIEEIVQLGQTNASDMKANPDLAESMKTLTPAEQVAKGAFLFGGESKNSIPVMLVGNDGVSGTIGGVYNMAAGAVKGFGEFWDDLERNTKSKQEQDWILIAKALGLFGLGAFGLNTFNDVFMGGQMGKGWKWAALLTIAGVIMHKSGEWGDKMANIREGKSPFAQTDFARGASSSQSNDDSSGSHIPTGERPFGNMKVSSTNPNPQDISNTMISMGNSTSQGHAGKGIPQNSNRPALPHDIEKALLANVTGKSSTSTIDNDTMSMIISEGELDNINIPYSQVASNDAEHSVRARV